MSIYRQFGVEPIINAAGPVTRLGGALLPDGVVEAMKRASQETVAMEELQAGASRLIARVTATEGGLVTCGASAGLTLGAAAILAGNERGKIERLPETEGMKREFLIARDQRNGYDHAVRAAGAKLIDVGMNEVVSGAGIRPVEMEDYEAALTEETVAVLYVFRSDASPRLDEVVAWAKRRGLKVLVDAAAELPPASNLREIPASGADLVVFSGGKAIRGPSGTGILCGKRALVESAALQMLDTDEAKGLWNPPVEFIDASRWPGLPRQGIGRGFKVGREEVVGLLVALELFVNQEGEWEEATRLRGERVAGLLVEAGVEAKTDGGRVWVRTKGEALEFVRLLRARRPAIYVRPDSTRPHELCLHLETVREDQERLLVAGIREALALN